MGGYDIFKSVKDEYGQWSKPQNHGYPINTPDDDVFFVISANGRNGYYASAKEGGFGEKDIYKVAPDTRKNEVLSFVKMGLEDFSISRSKARAKDWGVPVPGDSEQIMYVWFDALSNYITALDFAKEGKKYKKYWPADSHIIGKGIIRFHAVYWPAMLLSAGIPLPKELFIHGYINIAGGKMSKSLGNVIDPFELIKKYGVEPARYYLLRYIHPVQDSDFDIKHFEQAYTADLANGLGNLVARVSGLIERNKVKIKVKNQKSKIKSLDDYISNYQFDQAMKLIWEKISELDKFISEKEPWVLAKKGDVKNLTLVLTKAANGILGVANSLLPFLPEAAEKIISIFTAKEIKKGQVLFQRLDNVNSKL